MEELMDILRFSLRHAYVLMPDGRILRQRKGIPMGDPLSPGITILTCAWMEREWMRSLSRPSREFFMGARFMDDILMFMSNSPRWDAHQFRTDFERSECYWQPLRLEASDPERFLENTLVFTGARLAYRLKNDNEQECMIWRYHDYRSRRDYSTKRAIISGALTKVAQMCSDDTQLYISGLAKCEEFCRLHYPRGILKYLCKAQAFRTGNRVWFDIRDAV